MSIHRRDADKGCTAKALFVGLIGAVCLGLGSTYNDMIVKGSGVAIWNLTPGAIFLFFIIVVGNGFWRLIHSRSALARGELRCIGATTLDEYRQYIEKDPALERRFQPVYVGEPSVEDTIAILRGLKPRYEAHHNVKIKDSALVSAAQLSHRYITDRFLPDKAIDLVDEASSRLAMELESVPTEIDEVQRKLTQLELAARQLTDEDEATSQERLGDVETEMEQLRHKLANLREQWEAEKLGLGDVQRVRQELEHLDLGFRHQDAAIKEKQALGQPVSEAEYQTLYELDVKRRQLHQRVESEEEQESDRVQPERRLLRKEVTEEEIAEIVSSWTGVPVARMVETEKAKLLVMEERLHLRVVGQNEAVEAVSNAVRRSRSGLQDPNLPGRSITSRQEIAIMLVRKNNRGRNVAMTLGQ